MTDPSGALQEARALAVFIRHADSTNQIDPKNDAFWHDLRTVVPKGHDLDSLLFDLNQRGLVWYEEIGEEGFEPIIMAGCTALSAPRLVDLLMGIDQEVASVRRELKEILTFDPLLLTAELSGAQRQIQRVKEEASRNELLQPLLRPLGQIEGQLASVNAVASNYLDAYKNIIRPVQLEGQAGVKATVRWAVISIVISSILSLIIGNWTNLGTALQRSASAMQTPAAPLPITNDVRPPGHAPATQKPPAAIKP